MLNIDDRLIKETLPVIKPNGLAVLMVISIHLNKESGTCFPSHDRLMKMTGLGSESVYNALKALKKEGLLISSQSIDSKHKTFSRRTFKVNTDYIGGFVSAKNVFDCTGHYVVNTWCAIGRRWSFVKIERWMPLSDFNRFFENFVFFPKI